MRHTFLTLTSLLLAITAHPDTIAGESAEVPPHALIDKQRFSLTKPTSKVTSTWRTPVLKADAQRRILTPPESLKSKMTPDVRISSTDAAMLTVETTQGGDVNTSVLFLLVPEPVKKDDRLSLRFQARSTRGEGIINVRVGNTTNSAYATVELDIPVNELWQPFTVCWTSPMDADSRETDVRLRFGKVVQSLEVREVEVVSQGSAEVAWVVAESDRWRPIDMQDPDIQAGSALDFSGLWGLEPAGQQGHVFVNKDGHLAFSETPAERAVFWGCSVNMGPGGAFSLRHDIATIDGDNQHTPLTKDDLQAFANRVRHQGYNLFRPHFLDAALMEHAKPDETFDPQALDQFDYLVYCLKQNGVYLYLDAMTRDGGWSHGGGWGEDGLNRRQLLYHDKSARQQWAAAVEALLTHVNPYTGMALMDDPVLAVLLFCNEQEVDPWGQQYFPKDILPGFRAWVQNKYGSDQALRKAWTDGNGKCWLPENETRETVTADNFWGNSPRSRDVNQYIYEAETELLAWYEQTIRSMGFKGITTQYDAGMRYRDLAVRSHLPAVSIHAYANPVNGWILPGGSQDQRSSIAASELLYVRYAACSRFAGRPLLITEYNQEFWNPYRHEQGIAMAGYAAFQGHDMLVSHAHPVMLSVDRPIVPYFAGSDPINRATEVIAGLLFARQDVSQAQELLTVTVNDEFLFAQGRCSGGLVWEKEQSRLAFTTGISVAYTDQVKEKQGLVPGALLYSVNDLPPSQTILDRLIDAGKIPRGNRSRPEQGLFESSNGQLHLQCTKAQLEVSTPRTQGASLLAGATADLPALQILQTSTNAAIVLSAIDGQPIESSQRLLLIIATDALNKDMAFRTLDRKELASIGNTPALVRTGTFRLAIAGRHTEKLKAWGLQMTGQRAESLPVRYSQNRLVLDIDTSRLTAPYLFFELAVE